MPLASQVKDAGSIHARIWEQSESPPENPPNDIPDERGIITDSGRYLIRRATYPDAVHVTSCFSFSGLSAPVVEYLKRAILRSVTAKPGDFVVGAREFPRYQEDAALFLSTAGFDGVTTRLLSSHLSPAPVE